VRLVGIRRIFVEVATDEATDMDALIEFGRTAGISHMARFVTEDKDIVFDAFDFMDATRNEGSLDLRDYVIINFTDEGIRKARQTSDDYIGKELFFYLGDELITSVTLLHFIREDFMVLDADFTYSEALEIATRINDSIAMPYTMHYTHFEEHIRK